MDYKVKYEQAIADARAIIKDYKERHLDNIAKRSEEDFSAVFPELKESEDERIRKKLIEAVKRDMVVGGTKDKQLAIAWLEKQGEKEKFIKKELDCIRGYRDEAIRRLNELEKQGEHKHQYKSRPRYVGEEELLGVNKQGEQKPVPKFKEGDVMRTLQEAADGMTDGMPVIVSIDDEYYHCTNELIAIKDQDDYEYPPMNRKQKLWSEEDELALKQAIYVCHQNGYTAVENWLKSLSPKNTWKSSDEHYELEEFAKIVRCNLTGISKAVQKLFEAKYLQLTGNKMYGGFKD